METGVHSHETKTGLAKVSRSRKFWLKHSHSKMIHNLSFCIFIFGTSNTRGNKTYSRLKLDVFLVG